MEKLLIIFTRLDDSTNFLTKFSFNERKWERFPIPVLLDGSSKPSILFINEKISLSSLKRRLINNINSYINFYVAYHISDEDRNTKMNILESIIPKSKYNYCSVHHNKDEPSINCELEQIANAYEQNDIFEFKDRFNALLNNSYWKRIDTQKKDKDKLLAQLLKPPATHEETEVLFPKSLNSYYECWQIFLKCNPWEYHNDPGNKQQYREVLNEFKRCLGFR